MNMYRNFIAFLRIFPYISYFYMKRLPYQFFVFQVPVTMPTILNNHFSENAVFHEHLAHNIANFIQWEIPIPDV